MWWFLESCGSCHRQLGKQTPLHILQLRLVWSLSLSTTFWRSWWDWGPWPEGSSLPVLCNPAQQSGKATAKRINKASAADPILLALRICTDLSEERLLGWLVRGQFISQLSFLFWVLIWDSSEAGHLRQGPYETSLWLIRFGSSGFWISIGFGWQPLVRVVGAGFYEICCSKCVLFCVVLNSERGIEGLWWPLVPWYLCFC